MPNLMVVGFQNPVSEELVAYAKEAAQGHTRTYE